TRGWVGLARHDNFDRASECIPDAVSRPDESRLLRIVVERLANEADESRQARIRDIRSGPEALVELCLRQNARTGLHEHQQEVERSREQMYLACVHEEATTLCFEREAIEAIGHRWALKSTQPSTSARRPAGALSWSRG